MKGAIFDLDGTLLDSMPLWECVGERYLMQRGICADEGLSDVLFSMSMQEGAEYLKNCYALPEPPEKIAEDINQMVFDAYETEIPAKAGVKELLEKFSREGIRMAVATSTDRPMAEAALSRLGLLGYFERIFTCTETGSGKSSPDIYFAAARYLGTAPADTWVFEDALYAIRSAKKAGFSTVGIYDAASSREQALIRETADRYLLDWSLAEGKQRPAVLTIAGSDSSGGAGIQADIKTMMANGVYAMSAITALTAQNTTGVMAVAETAPELLRLQIDAVFGDIRPAAVKIGMTVSAEQIRVIAERLCYYGAKNVVVDPVMAASSGKQLIREEALAAWKGELFPAASLITPNIPEAGILCGFPIETPGDMERAAEALGRAYGCAVLIKGGHRETAADDFLWDDGQTTWFPGRRIHNPNSHGTGCTLSSAIASNLAKGYGMEASVTRAKAYLSAALSAMLNLGAGSGPMDHGFFGEWQEKDSGLLK